jgi:hypothetical protein
MPWQASQAQSHNKKADTPAKQKKWAKIANAALKTYAGKENAEGLAIATANKAMGDALWIGDVFDEEEFITIRDQMIDRERRRSRFVTRDPKGRLQSTTEEEAVDSESVVIIDLADLVGDVWSEAAREARWAGKRGRKEKESSGHYSSFGKYAKGPAAQARRERKQKVSLEGVAEHYEKARTAHEKATTGSLREELAHRMAAAHLQAAATSYSKGREAEGDHNVRAAAARLALVNAASDASDLISFEIIDAPIVQVLDYVCPSCQGSGKAASGGTCPECNGTGLDKVTEVFEETQTHHEGGPAVRVGGSPVFSGTPKIDSMQMFDAIPMQDAKVKLHEDGYLSAEPRIARTGIQIYKGSECGRPDLERVRVYRPESEVFKKDTYKTYTHLPITLEHPPVAVNSNNWKQYAIGETGDDVLRDGQSVRVPVMLRDSKAIAAYKSGAKQQLSVGYDTDLEWRSGKTDSGEEYDAIQRNIRCNHLALVGQARGGSTLVIGDEVGQWSS